MIVVGAGIAGSAVTRVLYELGYPVTAIDKRARAGDAGLAIFLPGNAIAALDQLGVWNAVAEAGYATSGREYRTDTGRLLCSIDEVDYWGERHQPRCMLRSDLLDILRGGLPEDVFSFGHELVSARQERGRVSLGLSGGGKLTSDKIIGADGVNSVVRTTLFGEQSQRGARLSGFSWRFMVANPGIEKWTVWLGSRSMVLLIPVSRDTAYGWATLTGRKPHGAPPRLDPDDFRTFPSHVRQTIELAASAPQEIHTSATTEVRMSRWSAGRVLLVGDAAHATAPVWAQGAALGLSAALTLRGLLQVETLGRWTSRWPTILSRFERQHRPRVEHVGLMTDKMSKAALMPPLLRNLAMPFLGPRSYDATFGPLRTL